MPVQPIIVYISKDDHKTFALGTGAAAGTVAFILATGGRVGKAALKVGAHLAYEAIVPKLPCLACVGIQFEGHSGVIKFGDERGHSLLTELAWKGAQSESRRALFELGAEWTVLDQYQRRVDTLEYGKVSTHIRIPDLIAMKMSADDPNAQAPHCLCPVSKPEKRAEAVNEARAHFVKQLVYAWEWAAVMAARGVRRNGAENPIRDIPISPPPMGIGSALHVLQDSYSRAHTRRSGLAPDAPIVAISLYPSDEHNDLDDYVQAGSGVKPEYQAAVQASSALIDAFAESLKLINAEAIADALIAADYGFSSSLSAGARKHFEKFGASFMAADPRGVGAPKDM